MSPENSSLVSPALLRSPDFSSLSRSLSARIMDDIISHPDSRLGEIHDRIGLEVSQNQISTALSNLRKQGKIRMSGSRKSARYAPS